MSIARYSRLLNPQSLGATRGSRPSGRSSGIRPWESSSPQRCRRRRSRRTRSRSRPSMPRSPFFTESRTGPADAPTACGVSVGVRSRASGVASSPIAMSLFISWGWCPRPMSVDGREKGPTRECRALMRWRSSSVSRPALPSQAGPSCGAVGSSRRRWRRDDNSLGQYSGSHVAEPPPVTCSCAPGRPAHPRCGGRVPQAIDPRRGRDRRVTGPPARAPADRP